MTFAILSRRECNVLAGLAPEVQRAVRKTIISSVLCTDMANHFSLTQVGGLGGLQGCSVCSCPGWAGGRARAVWGSVGQGVMVRRVLVVTWIMGLGGVRAGPVGMLAPWVCAWCEHLGRIPEGGAGQEDY